MGIVKAKGNMYPWVTHMHSHLRGAGDPPAPTGAGSTLPAGSAAQAANQTEANPPHSADAQRRQNNKVSGPKPAAKGSHE